MGLIINRLKQLLKGYPTVSDKYNVAGGTYEGATGLEVGEVVAYGSATGYYVAFMDGAKDAASVAGISMAKNVKLINQYPANGATVKIEKGEAIDLFVDGYIAVEVNDSVVLETKAASGATEITEEGAKAVDGHTYYSRVASTAGAGYLNDGEYAYTEETVVAGTTEVTGFFELAETGATSNIAEGVQAYIDVTTGKFTDDSNSNTNIPYGKFTGITEVNYGKKLVEIVVK